MRPTLFAIAMLAIAATFPAVSRADSYTPGFQFQADGLYFGPMGEIASQQHVKMTDLFGSGGGFAVTATVGVKRHWLIGVRVASYSSKKTTGYTFGEIMAPAGQTLADGSGPYTAERELKLLPVHALLQYRHGLTKSSQWEAEGGLGVLSTIDHMTLDSGRGAGELASIAGYQKDPSWTAGVGLSWKIPGNLDVVGSARYIGTLSGDGAAWLKDDDPSFTNWTLGLRYPHDTH